MKRAVEATLLILGLVLLDWFIWTRAKSVISQATAAHEFRQQQHKPQAGPRRLKRNDLVGLLEIPRLDMHIMVREGADGHTLEDWVGHLPSSPLPGSFGNVTFAAHRDTFFRPLRNIRLKDRIIVSTLGAKYAYEVESIKIVHPDDVSVLKAGSYPTLTLVTCYPFYYVGSAPRRFIVRARQIEWPAQDPSRQVADYARTQAHGD